jgi:hypothetical protein
MPTIITHPAGEAHPDRDAAARNRADRLAKATPEQMEIALAYLSVIDCEAFEIAFTAVAAASDDDPGDDEPFPVCRRCGSAVGIFPDQGLDWQHYTGDGITSGAQETYDPGHQPEVIWLLPNEDPANL